MKFSIVYMEKDFNKNGFPAEGDDFLDRPASVRGERETRSRRTSPESVDTYVVVPDRSRAASRVWCF